MATKLTERLIAFLDILGFSRRLATEPLEQLHETYSALIDKANETVFSGVNLVENEHGTKLTNFDYAGFHSDSVVLVSKDLAGDQAPQHAFTFVAAITTLLENGFAHTLPFRGCIGLGNVLLDEERRVLLSEALPPLLSLEKEQDWSGCIIHPDAEPRILALLFGAEPSADCPGFLIRHRVPLKEHPLERGLCVNWVSMLSDRDLEAGLRFLVGPKRDRTDEFVQYVRGFTGNTVSVSIPESPIVAVRLLLARGGMRIKFMDQNGAGVDPPNGFSLHLETATSSDGTAGVDSAGVESGTNEPAAGGGGISDTDQPG